jgi:hypothetical protein
MLKTDPENPARPFVLPMAYGILKGYIKRPLFFLLGTLLTLSSFKKRISNDLPPGDFVKAVALQGWMYIRLKEKPGQEKAYEIMRAVILPIALAVQQGNFRSVEAGRTLL